MTQVITVITPSYKPEAEHLLAAWESLRGQEMAAGWELEWLVRQDGPGHEAEDILPADPRIVHARGRHGGVSLTRNLALAQARGSLIKNLDQDDILTPGVLARDISHIGGGVRWVTSRVLDLLPDGSTLGFDSDPAAGPLEPGFVFDHWRSHGYRLPVHPTTICIERDLLVAAGGWMGVPGSDDTGMLIAVSMVAVGWFEPAVGLLYRKWPGQETARAEHFEETEWNLRMQLIEERGLAVAAGQLARRVPA
jgi:glycosyltransferase involved in cell wall biosynthesis